jgi:hypothetical protein
MRWLAKVDKCIPTVVDYYFITFYKINIFEKTDKQRESQLQTTTNE